MNNKSSVIDRSRNQLRSLNMTLPTSTQMSMISTTSYNSQTFKIKYHDDIKRVSLKIPFTYDDLIQKCISIYQLIKSKESYFLQSEDLNAPFIINDDENLNYYASFQEAQGQNLIKLVLNQVDEVIQPKQQQLEASGVFSIKEQNIKNSVSEEHGQQESITPYQHIINPQMIIRILSLLQEKGQVTKQDVQKLSLSNSQMNSEQELSKVTNQDSLNVIDQSEVIIYDILYCNSSKNLVKSEGDITQSYKSTNVTMSEKLKLQQSINEAELKLSQLQEKESLMYLKRGQKNLKNQYNSQFRYSYQGSIMQSGFMTQRGRTNSGQLETPRRQSQMRMSFQNRYSNNSLNMSKEEQIIQQQQQQQQDIKHNSFNQFNKTESNNQQSAIKLQLNTNNEQLQRLLNQHRDDDNISLISSEINTILEKNESMEISMILNESNINQSYMK
ncbi:UNKNOWN [Stylonychia lemnae]|uniref:PB1 domain-containing protein n=1 Tax=Stylonychia lemnae TaxID=5949 RepID=A0A077ZZF9_STYLE|nr:UNKNOWN [Stylonychia lemnae]|eukprot:CDW75310.1 UNKNOWN [Stylonychia lemnae]